jgi:pyruvate dehydrogenase E2 component (dihydrolipoyllysine-residue acetyltransferase)
VALEFRLPDIGEGLAEAEVIEWLVAEGAPVAMDQPLVQVETDKAVTDIPAPRAGVLLHQGAGAGSVVKVGEVLAVIGDPGERWDGGGGRVEGPPIVGSLQEAEFVRSPVRPPEPVVVAPTRASERSPGGAGALPLVRKLAKDLGVDLATVTGSGPGGRITRGDVERAAAGGSADRDRVRLSKLRRTIAERMARSWREIPHVTTFAEADAARLVEERARLARDVRPVPLEALFVLAVSPALGSHPAFNASVDGEDLLLARRLDIGLAVDTPDGLIVAVVRDAGERNVLGLADEVTRLTRAVRGRTVTPEDLTGNTFTISNIGAVGGEFGTPIIPYGTTAILSFGRIRDRVVARAGRPSIRPLLPLSLSYDHRVIDGASGRRFLSAVVDAIENPAVLFFR